MYEKQSFFDEIVLLFLQLFFLKIGSLFDENLQAYTLLKPESSMKWHCHFYNFSAIVKENTILIWNCGVKNYVKEDHHSSYIRLSDIHNFIITLAE